MRMRWRCATGSESIAKRPDFVRKHILHNGLLRGCIPFLVWPAVLAEMRLGANFQAAWPGYSQCLENFTQLAVEVLVPQYPVHHKRTIFVRVQLPSATENATLEIIRELVL